jgi:predicted ATP-dependent serine protease
MCYNGGKVGAFMSQVFSLENIVPKSVRRISTGIDELDFLYGHTGKSWGLPIGGISLWPGSGGVGKSRWAIEVAKCLCDSGMRVLYFQKETAIDMFVPEKMGSWKSPNFFISDHGMLDDQLKAIAEVRPNVVFVDSINAIYEYNEGRGAELIVNGDEGEGRKGYRQALTSIDAHAIFLAQLNQDGTTKGGTKLPHYVDQVFPINKLSQNGINIGKTSSYFFMHQGDKNRYGKTQYCIGLKHTNKGVECHSNARWYALSDNNDNSWWEHGRKPESMEEIPADLRGGGSKSSSSHGWLWGFFFGDIITGAPVKSSWLKVVAIILLAIMLTGGILVAAIFHLTGGNISGG